jgi:AcrR family transcriptional regulator
MSTADVFWRHGYEGVSLDQPTAAMGIAPPSPYGAFGNKAELYRAALDHYGSLDLSAMRHAHTLEEAVRALLNSAIAAITDPARERGCMVSSGLIAVHPSHQPLAVETAMRRALLRNEMVHALSPFLNIGEASGLALHLSAVLTGLSVQARDGVPSEALRLVVESVIAGLAAQSTRTITT